MHATVKKQKQIVTRERERERERERIFYREVDVRGRAPVLERRQVVGSRRLLLHVVPA
jgi:hypothetical protein